MKAYRRGVNRIRIVEIENIIEETPTVKTIYFRDFLCANAIPGQFLMIWIPNVDEVPMSLSTITSEGLTSITVAKVGEATKAIHELKIGDLFGIRGPFGKGFTISNGKTLVVGGGTGLAPLLPLTEKLIEAGSEITLIAGLKNSVEFPLRNRIQNLKRVRVLIATEDGSLGFKGTAVDVVRSIISEEEFDFIYACGRENMLFELYKLVKDLKANFEASLERYMRCGVGLCGSCCIGKYLVCKDGPVFNKEMLMEIEEEFGKFRRDECGKPISI